MYKYRQLICAAVLTLTLAFVLSNIARALYFNPRPFVVGGFEPLIPHEPDNGFPSDHALLFGTVASIAMFVGKTFSIPLWILATAVGLYRVYAGVHHLIDILASFGISLVSAYIAYAIIQKLWNNSPTNS